MPTPITTSTLYYAYPFGYDADDTPAPIPFPVDPTGKVSYFAGWTPPYEQDLTLGPPTAYPVPRDQMNQLLYDITNNLAQYQQYGTPFWVSATDNLGSPLPYPIFARVYYNAGGGFQIYENQVNGNTVTPGVDNSWIIISGDLLGVPTGTIIDFAGASPPVGYLACTGGTQLITSYPNLYAAIGTLWGGDGITTFGIPSLSRRVMMGSGGAGTSTIGNVVGNYGGSETAALTSVSQIPQHRHSADNGQTFVTGNGGDVGHQFYGGNHGATTSYTDYQGSATPSPFNIVQAAAISLKCIKT